MKRPKSVPKFVPVGSGHFSKIYDFKFLFAMQVKVSDAKANSKASNVLKNVKIQVTNAKS